MPYDQLIMQVWVGRLAMMGFLTSIVEEAITKKGTLGQVGFITPSPPLFYTIVGAATAATISATAVTLSNAATGKMTARQVFQTERTIETYTYCCGRVCLNDWVISNADEMHCPEHVKQMMMYCLKVLVKI